MSPQEIIEALKLVADPQTGKSIVEMNMISMPVIKDGKVMVTLKLNQSHTKHKGVLNSACQESILRKFPEADIHIHITTDASAESPVQNAVPQIRNIIAVGSGKGGVGKSTVAVNLALGLKALGAKVGLLDADVYGPSLPTMLGLKGQRPAVRDVYGQPKLVPIEVYGIQTMSIGYIIDAEAAVVLRGPRLGGIIKQFFNDCLWDDLDYLVIDLPPGTGDVQLTLVQTVPVTGAVIVTTPQEVALADAIKAVNMFTLSNINVPILGVVENMAWFTPAELPDNKYFIFGQGGGKELAKMAKTILLGQIPLVQGIREGGDEGSPAILEETNPLVQQAFLSIAQQVARQVAVRNETMEETKVANVQ
jgi:ATP-binding protein involved in chromosome partitioning